MATKIVTLTDICKSVKMDPKMARRKLRRVKDAPKTADTKHWAWTPGKVAAVKRVLTEA